MPPRVNSRYTFTLAVSEEEDVDTLFLTEREPFGFRVLNDNVTHQIAEGETLWTLAARFYSGVNRPASLWWVIADFQPDPIIDPTIKLEIGATIVIPSLRTVVEDVLSETRRNEVELS